MQKRAMEITRRTALGLGGAAAATISFSTGAGTAVASPGTIPAEAPPGAPVKVLINGSPGRQRSYAFPSEVDALVLDNGLAQFTFGRDDAGGVLTGWSDTSITATSVLVDGVELAHELNGVDPRDPDRQHSFYVDAGGGKTRLVCSRVDVLRVTDELVEVAFVDTTSTPLQYTHHLVMRRGRQGLYGFVVMTVVADTSLSEVRMNTRWNRGLLDHAFNWERGSGQQPTYAYLDTQLKLGDETWQVDGKNNPNLPWPDSNGGNLPAGTVYTKYNWSLYHHENPMFGHFGNGFGAWFTPLGGISDTTLCGFYGSGPQHQDLAIHQDALILNYFKPNHYGQTGQSVSAGYTRLYGPWFSFVTSGDQKDPMQAIAHGREVAETEIRENVNGSPWMDHPLYPAPSSRTTVTGKIELADGRPADGLWAQLSVEDTDTVFTIKEATYFVKTDAEGRFSLPGIPPAWAPGSTSPSTYTLYVFASKGSATQLFKRAGIKVSGPTQDLGTMGWNPGGPTTFLWQIGQADRTGGEYALAAKPYVYANPRSYEKPTQVPANLAFTVGQSWEPRDWYYAQTKAGTWTVNFDLDRTYTGTAVLTVSTSLQERGIPTVDVNGSTAGITGTIPSANDSTIARQADRSGYPRLGVLTFPASLLKRGANTIAFTRGASGSGVGWDTVLLEVDETSAPRVGSLTAFVSSIRGPRKASVWSVTVVNTGMSTAYDVRLAEAAYSSAHAAPQDGSAPQFLGSDPNEFPLPMGGLLLPGAQQTIDVTLDLRTSRVATWSDVDFTASANGGRVTARTAGSRRPDVVELG